MKEDRGRVLIPEKLTRIFGLSIGIILAVFETIICAQYIYEAQHELWQIISLVFCCVALDVLCFVELYKAKTLKVRIIFYCFDFVLLLFVCVLTGNSYLAALYCVILSQLYLNVYELKTKAIVLLTSCVLFIVTSIVGTAIVNRRSFTYNEIIDVALACLVGLLVLVLHFAIANFLIGFYRNNVKLSAALKEADERKKELEEAYEQLSETAVFQERNRIARDIHDNAGHSITAVIMQTEAAKLLVDTDPQEAKAKIVSANMQAKNALEQMRESVHLLAGRGEVISLKSEIEEILAQTMDGTEIKIRYSVADVSLSGERRRFICNTLKELLANGIRHGGAGAFYVELSSDDETVVLTVSDNGSGLPEDFKEGFGLSGIRERSTGFGGGVVYESESGDGCEITVTINLV